MQNRASTCYLKTHYKNSSVKVFLMEEKTFRTTISIRRSRNNIFNDCSVCVYTSATSLKEFSTHINHFGSHKKSDLNNIIEVMKSCLLIPKMNVSTTQTIYHEIIHYMAEQSRLLKLKSQKH